MKQKLLAAILSLSLCVFPTVSVFAQEEFSSEVSAVENLFSEDEPTDMFTSGDGSEPVDFSNDPVSETEEELVTIKGITYEYQADSDSYIVVKGSGQEIVSLVTEIDGKKVTAIGPKAFYHDKMLKQVLIFNDPKKTYRFSRIGESAFEGCSNLTTLDFLADLYEKNSFYGCRKLTKLILSNSYVCSGAFQECPKLVSIDSYRLDGETGAFDIDNKIILSALIFSNIDAITTKLNIRHIIDVESDQESGYTLIDNLEYKNSFLVNCRDAKKGTVSIASRIDSESTYSGTIRIIGRRAFYGCSNITEVIIPSTITTIENEAFYGCPSLHVVHIPSSVTIISASAFQNSPNVVINTEPGSYAASYAADNHIPCVTDGSRKLGRPGSPVATVKGNTVKVKISAKSSGAEGYEIVYGKRNCHINGTPIQKKTCGKNGSVTFYYVRKGNHSIYARAYKTINGKKVYSDWTDEGFAHVTAVTPYKPKITKVTASGSTVTVWLSEAKNAQQYDVILCKKRSGAKPLDYIYSQVNKKGRKLVFKNVKNGIYYVAARSSNISGEDKSRAYSKWAGIKKITVN